MAEDGCPSIKPMTRFDIIWHETYHSNCDCNCPVNDENNETTKSTSSRYTTATLGRKLNKQTSHVPRTSTNGTVHHRAPLTRRHSTFQPRTSLLCDSGDSAVPLSHHADIDAEQMDLKLLCHDDGINLAFDRTKAWSKYCKDILHYVKTRIQMESEYAKKIQGLAEQSKLQMTENYVPLKEVYQKCFEADCSFSQDTFTTMKYLNERYIVPLEKRRTEHENCRRQLKNEWNKVTKQLQECHADLKKSKTNLVSREQGYKKARDQFARLETVPQPISGNDLGRRKKEVEKRRRAEGDACSKKKDAEDQVRQLEADMKRCREEVENSKVRIIAQLRELVYQCDQTTKACSDHYFQALANLWVRVPGKYQELSHETRTYTPGSEYMSFLQNLPGRSISSAGLLRSDKCVSDDETQGNGLSKGPTGSQRIRRNAINPDHQEMLPEPSSVRRPKKITSRFREQAAVTPTVYSEAAKSHTLQRIRQPTKCQHCDALSIWSTYQCRVCHQAFHKSCLERLKLNCGSTSKVLTDCARRMSIFGVPLKGHLDDQNRTMPLILEKCIDELQSRGMRVKGIYRTCGVKSKVEQICEHFEKSSRDADVDLSDIHPMNIASVVKLYLRKLPDPLMTFDLYPDWIKFAKRISANELNATMVSEMKELTSRLPKQNFDTLQFLVLHLARVTWFEVDNLMTASNLAAVISPSLMWCHKATTSSNAYLEDAPLLTKTVEFIIKNAYEIFTVDRASDFRSFFEKYTENEQPEAVDAETEAHLEEEAEIELGEDEDDDEYDLDEDEEQICTMPSLSRRISAQPPTPDLLKNTRGSAENNSSVDALAAPLTGPGLATSFDLEYGCPSQYSVGSSNCTESSSGSSSAHVHPQLEKRRSYTTSILVSPQADRRLPGMQHKQRSVDESAYTGASVQSGDVTVEIGTGQYYVSNSDRRERVRAAVSHTGSGGGAERTHDESQQRICHQSVGLLFSATDNDVSYV